MPRQLRWSKVFPSRFSQQVSISMKFHILLQNVDFWMLKFDLEGQEMVETSKRKVTEMARFHLLVSFM